MLFNIFKNKNKMKYWICNDKDGMMLYYGSIKPVYNKDCERFEASKDEKADYDWIPEYYLKPLYIKLPNINIGECKRIFINIKTKW